MADEGRGVALAILGIVAVIAVVGLVLLFTGATGRYASQKVYGGALRGEEFPYLTDRTQGGFPSTAGTPDAVPYPAGFYSEKPVPVALQEDAPHYGTEDQGTYARNTYGRLPYYVPSGQMCSSGGAEPGFRCPQGTTCIANWHEAESGGWVPAPEHPCYKRVNQG